MSTTLEPQVESDANNTNSAVQRLRTTMAASRVGFNWFGATKSLSDEQKATVAQSFGADREVLSAGKRLLNTKHPTYKQVNSAKSRINSYWKGETLPFPQAGIRLIRQDNIEQFNDGLSRFKGSWWMQ